MFTSVKMFCTNTLIPEKLVMHILWGTDWNKNIFKNSLQVYISITIPYNYTQLVNSNNKYWKVFFSPVPLWFFQHLGEYLTFEWHKDKKWYLFVSFHVVNQKMIPIIILQKSIFVTTNISKHVKIFKCRQIYS